MCRKFLEGTRSEVILSLTYFTGGAGGGGGGGVQDQREQNLSFKSSSLRNGKITLTTLGELP